jgi:hypothetical protein
LSLVIYLSASLSCNAKFNYQANVKAGSGHPKGVYFLKEEGLFVKKTLLFSIVLLVTLASVVSAQNRRAPAASTLLSTLPKSDAVAFVKLSRVLDEAMPKLLAGKPTKLTEINAHVENFKTRTGVDPRSFEDMVFGIRYTHPSEGVTKFKTIALARGTFSAGALAAAGRIASDGQYREEHFQDKTIYIFTLDQQLRIFGLLDIHLGELAVAPIDANTLTLGEPATVREFIGLRRSRGKVNAELIALANREPNALLGFGGNITPELQKTLSLTNDAIARDLTSVRQVYGSVGLSATDLNVMIAARTVDEFAARNLAGTVEGLKQFGGLFVNRLPAAKAALARNALSTLTITNQGNELQIRTSVAQTSIAPVFGGM